MPRPAINGFACLFAALLACGVAVADSWAIGKAKRTYRFRGGLTVIAGNDAAKIPEWPYYYVRIKQGGKSLAHIRDAGFELLVASPDEQLFVGLSNLAFTNLAAIVFDRRGRVLFEAWHDEGITSGFARYYHLDYCWHSITKSRVWFDAENPDVRFGPANDAASISLMSCRGQRIHLVEAVKAGERRAREQAAQAEKAQEEFMRQMLERTVPAKNQ
jgi:hypothetical protein